MTDNSDRQDGDFGAYNNFKTRIGTLFCNVVNGVNGVISSKCGDLTIEREHNGSITLSKRAAELLTGIIQSPTHDDAEGADDLPPDAEHPINYRKAFAKPALDAMRGVIRNAMNHLSHSGLMLNDNESLEYLTNAVATTGVLPQADGISPFACAKCGMYYCTHSISERFPTLSTSPAVAAEPERRELTQQEGKLINQSLLASGQTVADFASTPVSGDRESSPDDIRAHGWAVAVHNDYRQGGEAHTFWLFTNGRENAKGEGKTDAEALNQVRAILSLPIQPVAPRLPQDTIDRLAMLKVSQEEVYEVLKKHLPEDMIDGIWQEIKEAEK